VAGPIVLGFRGLLEWLRVAMDAGRPVLFFGGAG
jgi:hypothetical protein